MFVQDWINKKLKEIADKLPTLAHTEPASFSCGYNVGYKNALLDLEHIIEDGYTIYMSNCWCGDKYHDKGGRCL